MAELALNEERSVALRRVGTHSPVFLISAAIVGILVLVAILADWIMPHDPYVGELSSRLLPPFWYDKGSFSYPLGTDSLGRDILSRIILGTRVSLAAALAAILLGGGIGTILGLLAGYYGRIVDSIIMRVVDAMLGFPIIFLALILAVVMGPSFWNVILVIGLVLWARFARVVRGEVLSLKTRDFVALARIAGASAFRIILRHVFPNVTNTVIVMITLQVGWVVLVEASLSFLGAGIPPPSPSLGSMVAAGRDYASSAWWVSAFPGVTIVVAVLALNLLGDWLRDTLDPKLRQV